MSRLSRSKTVALVAICLGYFMTILDVTAVNVALPSIRHDLGATVAGLQWVVDGYALVFAALLLSAGSLGDRRGNRRMFVSGLVVFTFASALCGLSPSLWMLQAARVIQGVGAALLVPTSLALLRHTFTDPARRARGFGIYGGIAGIAAAAGPVLGGALTSLLSWRAVFFANVPVGVLAVLLTLRYAPPAPRLSGRGLDACGQLAVIVALGLLTFSFIEGGVRGWGSPLIVAGLAIALLATAAFAIIERRVEAPMLPPALFGNRAFSAGNAVGLLINLGFYGQFFLISLFFQHVRGLSALYTGLALLPEAGIVTIASTLSGRVAARAGPWLPMVTGTAIGGCGLLAMTWIGRDTSYAVICLMLLAVGFGMAFTMPAMTAAVMEAAPGEHAGIAGGVLNAARQVGSVIGVALLGSLVNGQGLFVPGFHTAMAVAGLAFLSACGLTLLTRKG